ncbi:MAG: hypothetical protein K2O69_03130, partial [Odoribacter sp.]|nr:hypothetical protein [Odoribacter sp.]
IGNMTKSNPHGGCCRGSGKCENGRHNRQSAAANRPGKQADMISFHFHNAKIKTNMRTLQHSAAFFAMLFIFSVPVLAKN